MVNTKILKPRARNGRWGEASACRRRSESERLAIRTFILVLFIGITIIFSERFK